jgi:hypothetical protein
MAEISEKARKERNKGGRPAGRKQVEHFIMRITPLEKSRLVEMAGAKGMDMSEFNRYILNISWKNYQKGLKA